MNIWAIDIDIPLKVLLLELVHQFGENTLMLINPEQHYQAAEIATFNDKRLSAYIYTFGQNRGYYGLDLKYPIVAHNIIGENENLSLNQTLDIITIHLFSENFRQH